MTTALKSPFPFFGGKSTVAHLVWERLGNVANYVEPFAGSLAVLLCRPHAPKIETVNDADGYIANFWRAAAADPEQVAKFADWPVNENDQHARHVWLLGQKDSILSRLEGDPDWFDAKVAGWWVWGMACWISQGWCSGDGPWQSVEMEDGSRQLVHLGNQGRGVNRQLVHLGNQGQGVNRQLVHLGNQGRGVNRKREELYGYFNELADRLRNVRVCCGDWSRVCGPSVTFKHGLTGVFLDPPYSHAERDSSLYSHETDCAAECAAWAIEQGSNPLMRIAFCGYAGEHEFPPDWKSVKWKTAGGFGSQGNGRGRENCNRETIWFSPACLEPRCEMPLEFAT